MTDHSAQMAHYARNFEPSNVVIIDTDKPKRISFQEYFATGTPAKAGNIGAREPEKNEIRCPVCRCAGREQVDGDCVRIYHPQRLTPCRAPEGYVPAQKVEDQLL